MSEIDEQDPTTNSATQPRDVSEADFVVEVLARSRDRGVVVDFWAPWCGPCHQLTPILERVAARHAGDVDLVKVNVDEAPAMARRYQVQGIPAVKAFRDGAVVAEFTGVQSEAAVEKLFASLAPKPADELVARAVSATGDEREQLLRTALEHDPGHETAVAALARLLAERGDADGARELLERVPADGEIARLRAELSLADATRDVDALDQLRAAADTGDAEAALELGRALAAEGAHEEALQRLLAAARAPATREAARTAVLEVFQLLGDDDELVRAARPRLASALFS